MTGVLFLLTACLGIFIGYVLSKYVLFEDAIKFYAKWNGKGMMVNAADYQAVVDKIKQLDDTELWQHYQELIKERKPLDDQT